MKLLKPVLLAWLYLMLSCTLSLAQIVPGPEQILYSFQGPTADGAVPAFGLVMDSSGDLYGTTQYGGNGSCNPNGIYPPSGCGTVFELSPNGTGGWTKTILYNFQGGSDGEQPSSGLVLDPLGNLFGTTHLGGASNDGTVFELTHGVWTETILYSFQGNRGSLTDGASPQGNLLLKSGNLYGTTTSGGNQVPACAARGSSGGCGTIFELTPNGSSWTESVLYRFGGTEGYSPNGGLVFDQSGNLYGTTETGGSGGCPNGTVGAISGCGTLFELSPGVSGWTETALYNFLNLGDGTFPTAGVIFDQSGNLYGTAGGGSPDAGVVFEFRPDGSGGWTETILHNFNYNGDGADPSGTLTFDRSGDLYGVAASGGATNQGIVFELSPNGGSAWTETVLYNFQAGNDGDNPVGGVIFDQSGHLYGNTQQGGGGNCRNGAFQPAGCGTVFEVFKEPFVAFSPATDNFGSQTIAIPSSNQPVSLTNNGNLPLAISSILVTGANSGDFLENNDCPASLSPAASCTINVTFTPAALGNRNASLSVTDSAPGSPQTVTLSGVGVSAPITLSPSTVTFPSQYAGTTGLPQNVTLTNTGNGPVTITGVTTTPADFAATSGCGSMVQPGNSCSIGIFFDPTTSGTRTGTLTVVDSGSATPQTVTLIGMGQDFDMAASSSSSATVAPGQTATYTVALTPGGGFNQTVSLSCSGAPAKSTCSLSSSSLVLNGSSPTPVTVTVMTAGTSASLFNPAGFPHAGNRLALWLTLPGFSGLVLLSSSNRSRKRARGMLYVVALLCLLGSGIIWSGCGGGSNNAGGGSGGTPAGSYNITVTGAFTHGSTTLTHSTKLTLVVQ